MSKWHQDKIKENNSKYEAAVIMEDDKLANKHKVERDNYKELAKQHKG